MKAEEYLKNRKIKDVAIIPDYPTETGYFLSQIMEDYAKQEAIEFGEWLEQNNRFNAPLSISQQHQKFKDDV